MYSKESTTVSSPVFSQHSQMSQVWLSPLYRLGKLRPHSQQAVEAGEHPHPSACECTHVLGQEESWQCTRQSLEHTHSWWCSSSHCFRFLNTFSVIKELNCWRGNRQHIAKLPTECIPSTWGVGNNMEHCFALPLRSGLDIGPVPRSWSLGINTSCPH